MLDNTSTNQRIAVVGAGVAGLGAAWLLARRHQVTLFERNSYIGGHTNTLMVNEDGWPVQVDTGFIVYNEPNYPNLTALFAELGVQTRDSEMSFGVSVGDGELEYAGSSLGTLFAQRRNLGSARFLGMLADILRFNWICKRRLASGGFGGQTVGELFDELRLGHAFRHHYLLPMAAAIWSCPVSSMLAFPAASLARFYANHGLLNILDRPQWRTVTGGSRQYVEHMLASYRGDVFTDSPVSAVRRGDDGVELTLADGSTQCFDQVVLASHADESLALLEDASPTEQSLLSAFAYQANRAVLHSDVRLMPQRRAVWSSWNYLAESAGPRLADQQVSVTYWMNRLQGLDCQREYLVTLNPLQEPDPALVHADIEYQHPVFDSRAMAAQQRLASLQGKRGTWFCGSYFGYGFHEDALRSGVEVARGLGVDPGWDGHLAAQRELRQKPDLHAGLAQRA
jgi:predicted NAD/FAD-binding protein